MRSLSSAARSRDSLADPPYKPPGEIFILRRT